MYYIFTAYYYILFEAVARRWPQSAASAASITPGNYHVLSWRLEAKVKTFLRLSHLYVNFYYILIHSFRGQRLAVASVGSLGSLDHPCKFSLVRMRRLCFYSFQI